MSQYISKEALQELRDELAHRERELRKQITQQIASAKEQGDLSENFEYQDAKDRQAENEQRIAYLQDFIRNAHIIEPSSSDSIELGSSFTVKKDGEESSFSLVGATEANPMEGKLSHESPIGKAFLGHGAGDTVTVEVPNGSVSYTILSIN
jgi:transcription elongation factor GreA